MNRPSGLLIVNADDWGLDRRTTEMIFDCIRRESVSSVSAMVFMEDSENAAATAREWGIDAGLHLNFTAPFSAPACPTRLKEHHASVAAHLRRHRFAPAVFHPGLVRSFEYVVAAQLGEFCRLYGAPPRRLDGHHHMHLCANVLLQNLMPSATVVRRTFSFQPGEKGAWNRAYRRTVDRILTRRHHLVDLFFSLMPLEPAARLERIFAFASRFTVEIETHPASAEEHRFLTTGAILRCTGGIEIAPAFAVSTSE